MNKQWTWNGEFPTRCRLVDVEGKEVAPGWLGRTPEKSKPHIGQEGNAILSRGVVQITLDSGHVIYGHECWWEAIPPKEAA